jgi:DNA modification methylase
VTVYLQDPDLTIHQGDALETLRQLPDESAHMCVTSPPFYGLRDYGVDGQIGLEETPEQWVTNLVDVFREVRRVLRADGTLWLEVGDSYASNWPCNRRNVVGEGSLPNGKRENRPPRMGGDLKDKDLIGAPWLLAFALRADGWWLRADIIWARPNPMPESVTDRPTKSHSYLFLLAKSARYFYDPDAIREPHESTRWGGPVATNTDDWKYRNGGELVGVRERDGRSFYPEGGRNARSVWNIPTQPLAEPHYAAYPEELARRAILAGTSERGVCPKCGAPWRRRTEVSYVSSRKPGDWNQGGYGDKRGIYEKHGVASKNTTTTGWDPTCGCRNRSGGTQPPVPATVLDCFLGSGTTALVARKHGRHCIGIELNPAYCEIAERRTRQLSLLGDAA